MMITGEADATPTPQFSIRPTMPRWRTLFAIAMWVCGVLLVAAMIVTPRLELRHVVGEDYGALEQTQVVAWLLVTIVAGFGCLKQKINRGLLLLAWIGVLACCFGMRELDLQVLVNTDNIHHLGLSEQYAIHWRTRWLLDGDVPLYVRGAWIAILATIGALVILPFALARYPWPSSLLIKRDPFPWTLALGFGLLGASVLIDDVIGRPLRERGYKLDLLEELVETGGCLLVLLWTAWLASGKANLRVPESS